MMTTIVTIIFGIVAILITAFVLGIITNSAIILLEKLVKAIKKRKKRSLPPQAVRMLNELNELESLMKQAIKVTDEHFNKQQEDNEFRQANPLIKFKSIIE